MMCPPAHPPRLPLHVVHYDPFARPPPRNERIGSAARLQHRQIPYSFRVMTPFACTSTFPIHHFASFVSIPSIEPAIGGTGPLGSLHVKSLAASPASQPTTSRNRNFQLCRVSKL